MFDVIITYALFAGGITANKYVLNFLSPVFFVGLRMFSAGLILLAYQAYLNWEGSRRMIRNFFAHDFLTISTITLCTTFVPSNLKSFALKYLPASKATLLGSIDPFVTALFAYILWRERLTRTKVLGIIIGCAALMVSILSHSNTDQNWYLAGYLSTPEMAQLAAVIISRYGWILVQKILRSERYSPAALNSIVMLTSGTCSLMWAWIAGDCGLSRTPPTIPFISTLLFTIFFGNVIGYTLYGWCLKRHTSTFMALAGFLVPLGVAAMSNLLLGEPITLSFIFSAALLFIGLGLFYSAELKQYQAH